MKIILLNPLINAGHEIAKKLQKKGVALLFPVDAEEAWQMLQLHGKSVDLMMMHLEGHRDKDPVLGVIEKIKKDPKYTDLPLILTTKGWSEDENAAHQESPFGANAYLSSPWTEAQLIQTIEAVVGSLDPKPGFEPVLVETKEIFKEVISQSSIKFEAPAESEVPTVEKDKGPEKVKEPEAGADKTIAMPASAAIDLQIGSPEQMERQADSEKPVETAPEEVQGEVPGELPEDIQEEAKAPKEAEHAAKVAKEIDLSQMSIASEMPSEEIRLSDESETPAQPKENPKQEQEDEQLAREMPYLFKNAQNLIYSAPVGDAVVPGGIAQTPDLETIKKYLLLREQDVAILSNQLKIAQEEITKAGQALAAERAKIVELTHLSNEQARKIGQFEQEKNALTEKLQEETMELKFRIKTKQDQVKLLEKQAKDTADQMDRLKERVRVDIRKIRIRERELENQLELARKDGDVLLTARENKIIELKRKIDLLEFNMDLIQEQLAREKENSLKLRDRLEKAAQAHKVAMGLLDTDPGVTVRSISSKDEPGQS